MHLQPLTHTSMKDTLPLSTADWWSHPLPWKSQV